MGCKKLGVKTSHLPSTMAKVGAWTNRMKSGFRSQEAKAGIRKR